MIVWKVVRAENRRSAMITGELSIEYKKGILVKPINPRFPIYAFNKEKHAKYFINNHMSLLGYNLMILRCEATKSKSKSLILSDIVNLGIVYHLSFKKILKLMKYQTLFDASSEYPGTVKCSSIKPLQ